MVKMHLNSLLECLLSYVRLFWSGIIPFKIWKGSKLRIDEKWNFFEISKLFSLLSKISKSSWIFWNNHSYFGFFHPFYFSLLWIHGETNTRFSGIDLRETTQWDKKVQLDFVSVNDRSAMFPKVSDLKWLAFRENGSQKH